MAGALVLLSQIAWSDEAQVPAGAPTEAGTRLPAPQMAPIHAKIEAEVQAHVEALNRRLAEDLARAFEDAVDAARIELAIAEVPTHG